MAFTPKVWKDAPDPSTPVSAAALVDLEQRVANYGDAQVSTARGAANGLAPLDANARVPLVNLTAFGDMPGSGKAPVGMQAGAVTAFALQPAPTTGMSLSIQPGQAVAPLGGVLYAPTGIAGTVTLDAAHATLPRIDSIYATPTGTTANSAFTYSKVTGTPTSGATLDNRTGAAATPTDGIRLCDVLVPAASVSVTAGNVRDRRPWARGAFIRVASSTGDINVSTSGSALFGYRSEIAAGNTIEMRLNGQVYFPAAGNFQVSTLMDNVSAAGAPTAHTQTATGVNESGFHAEMTLAPSAGSHIFAFFVFTGAVGPILRNNATNSLIYSFREVVAPSAANG